MSPDIQGQYSSHIQYCDCLTTSCISLPIVTWQPQVTLVHLLLSIYPKYIGYFTHTWARKCIFYCQTAKLLTYSWRHNKYMTAHSFLMQAARCQTISEINSYCTLHNFKLEILFPAASNYDSRCKMPSTARSLWHLAGQTRSATDHRNCPFNQTGALLGQTQNMAQPLTLKFTPVAKLWIFISSNFNWHGNYMIHDVNEIPSDFVTGWLQSL